MRYLILLALLVPSRAFAQDAPCPPPYAVCLTADEKKTVGDSLRELKEIKESKAEVKVKDDIVIVRDWQDRIYVNGGSGRPIKATLKLGGTVERDLEIQLPVQTFFRQKPPDPMFRLRVRAQAGVLVPQLFKTIKGNYDFLDAGFGFDVFHIGPINLSMNTGIRSFGISPGVDFTKNFGLLAGYAMTYDGFKSSILVGAFFSLN